MIPTDYAERCYAGWLGKLIGVRFGVPVEGWSYENIRKIYGRLDTYIDTYTKLFAADDDTNAPLALLSALYDYTYTEDITPRQIGLALLNHAPYEHGFFWWGGYGKSTEHTAYINLRDGLPAPLSGSVEHNGAAVAEQIGGQIFIDPWGLIAPGDPHKAARYAAKAASVTHGGNGVYGGMFVAACIAAAFTERDIRKVLEAGLSVIPADCEYARMTRDIMALHSSDSISDWEQAFDFIRRYWGYDRYPGVCHIIPNSAVMVMSMLYGQGDFSRTLCICNMCGWDTDCNVGNVGAIMGVLVGLGGIDKRWRDRVGDAFAVSTVLGCRNFLDAPWCAAYIANLGYKIAGEEVPERWREFLKPEGLRCHFEFPGSTHGLRAYAETTESSDLDCALIQTDEDAASGTGALKAVISPLRGGERFRICKRTHFRPEDFHDNRYDPAFSPLVYPGQAVRVKLKSHSGHKFHAALYAIDGNSGTVARSEETAVGGDWAGLAWTIPAGTGVCIDEVGVSVSLDTGWDTAAALLLDDLTVEGEADYGIDFAQERVQVWNSLHMEISQFTCLRGIWTLENDAMVGASPAFAEVYTGHAEWRDIDFTGTVTPLLMPRPDSRAGLGFRVQGAARGYCAALEAGKLRLMKNEECAYRSLAEIPFKYEENTPVTLRVTCSSADIRIYDAGGAELIAFTDQDAPYLNGCVGAVLAGGARAAFKDWHIRTGAARG
ncbi:MAG: ADP-ribosylglycohydrolase family protein [Clostridiales bacterium]|jgi:ADP-ribosylglycohydrolase|nr:ADP-ribosylglycohydrolase family protein [Clostridiales bacterium]